MKVAQVQDLFWLSFQEMAENQAGPDTTAIIWKKQLKKI
jgi:hypothetical protein